MSDVMNSIDLISVGILFLFSNNQNLDIAFFEGNLNHKRSIYRWMSFIC